MIELDSDIRFTFESIGREKIPKIIEYSLIIRIKEFDIFNLGFGTHDVVNKRLLDQEISNNGDVFKIFNTILLSISLFFSLEPDALVLISGSDSGNEYVDRCRMSCIKNCEGICRNENRRINIYRKVIERNYDLLSRLYSFFGSSSDWDDPTTYEPFQSSAPYRSILIQRK